MKEVFENWKPSSRSMVLLQHIDDILASYTSQGYVLTLRQLYYQLVARDIIPNSIKSYNAIGNIVSKGRKAGFIDWGMIEDRIRNPKSNNHWSSPKGILEAAARQFYMSRWKDQGKYIEVWCEKDAVSNILEPICAQYDVLFLANRGYGSQTALYDASKRFQEHENKGDECLLLYFGDHDPSGIDMSRDIAERLGLFLGYGEKYEWPYVERIALNIDQIRKFNPPENPAKISDSRYDSYVEKFGESSWELDALEPSTLRELLEDAIIPHINFLRWQATINEEEEQKRKIMDFIESEF